MTELSLYQIISEEIATGLLEYNHKIIDRSHKVTDLEMFFKDAKVLGVF